MRTKVWVTNFAPDRFEASVVESVQKLGTDHVDLFLLHRSNGREFPRQTQIALLNTMREKGLTRHISVSNYSMALMREAPPSSLCGG